MCIEFGGVLLPMDRSRPQLRGRILRSGEEVEHYSTKSITPISVICGKGFMKIEGSHKISAPRERVFEALNDPAVLQKCIPGCESLEKTSENHYNAKLSAGVGAIKSKFTATVIISDLVAPSHYKLTVEGKGQPGFVKGSGDLSLEEFEGGTEIKY